MVSAFTAQIVVLNRPNGISSGYVPCFHLGAASMSCQITSLKSLIDRRTGKTLEEKPKKVKNNESAIVEIKPMKPMSCSPFVEFPPFGTFLVRDQNRTVAVGLVKSV